jgi:2-keto-3-deoxy-L-rhamnonate aldolase RhmA
VVSDALLRTKLASGDRLIGTWIKTPSPIVVEVLADTELDLVILDAEHAPFGRFELDACVFAAKASGMDVLVRVPNAEPHHILQALDTGATGVLVPHVRTAEEAVKVSRSARFGPGGRGYAGSTRAAGYGTKPMAEHKAESDSRTVVVVQLEDAEAVAHAGEIAAIEGIDGIFIGTVDLSVSLDASGPDAPAVLEAVDEILRAACEEGCPVGVFANSAEQVSHFAAIGATLFLMQSDHAFLRSGAAALTAMR